MNSTLDPDEEVYKLAFNIGKRLLNVIFRVEVDGAMTTMDHARQPDSKSCGVFTCYYAEQFAKGIFLFISYKL